MNKLFFLSALLFSFRFLHAQGDLATISMQIPTVAAQTGREVCLDITAENFDGIFGLSFTILFDAGALEYRSIRNINLPSATLNDNFNVANAGIGEIRMLWTSLSNEDYPSPFSLFTLCFRVKGPSETIARVQFADDPVKVEVIGEAGENLEDFVQGKFTNGAVWIRSGALPSLPKITGEIGIFSCEEIWKAEVDIAVSGGLPPYSFNWSGPEGFQSAEEDLPLLDFGVYSLTVTDQNQSPAFATFYLAEPETIGDPKPIVQSAAITAAVSCLQPDGAITLYLNQTTGISSFSWSNGATTQNLSGIAAGEYKVTIVDEKGCAGYWSGVVPKANDFEVRVSASPAICLREKGRLVVVSPLGANYQYAWSNLGEGTISGNGTTVGSLKPGTYGLTVTNTATGCVKTQQPTVPAGGNVPLAIETEVPKCDGTPGSISLQLPSGLFAVNWSTGDQTTGIGPLQAGLYAVTVTDQAGGCVRTEEVNLPTTQISLDVQTQCLLSDAAPDSVYLTVTPSGGRGPYTFEWSNGLTTVGAVSGRLGDRAPAALFATVTDQDGCLAYSESNAPCGEIAVPAFNASLYYECADEPANIPFTAYVWAGGAPPYSFKWSNGFQEMNERSSATRLTGAGFSSVTITDAGGLSVVLAGGPLLADICQGVDKNVQLIAPDLFAEVNESFFLPLRLGEGVVPETLEVELHWDPVRLELDSVTAEKLSLNASIGELSQRGKARLFFPLNQRQAPGEELARFQFTARGTAGEVVPIILGYNQWSATGSGKVYPIIPRHGSVTLLPDGSVVWPGDTDQNGEVDHRDLLNIGLGYGAAGPPRANAGLRWEGQFAPAWERTTPESRVDYKHIDADGNGLIEAGDTTAISVNWSRLAPHFLGPDDEPGPVSGINGAPLFVAGGNISSDEYNVLPIVLGTADQPAENVYGLAFSVRYEGPVSTDHIWVDFSDSWLGADGSPLLSIYRHFPIEKRVDIALVRTNGQGASGFGTIAGLILRGNNRTNGPQPAGVETLGARMIDPMEKTIETAVASTPLAVDFNTSLNEPAWARAIEVLPVPASDELIVRTGDISVESMQIINLQGQATAIFPTQNILPVGNLAPGIYLLRIQTSKGVVLRRWVKN